MLFRSDFIMKILNIASSAPTTVSQLQSMVQTAMDTQKCRKCGCMKETLLTIQGQLSALSVVGSNAARAQEAALIRGEVDLALGRMAPIEYT